MPWYVWVIGYTVIGAMTAAVFNYLELNNSASEDQYMREFFIAIAWPLMWLVCMILVLTGVFSAALRRIFPPV